MDYTLVLGVDANHLEKLKLVWPTWVQHKPSLLQQHLVVFYDPDGLDKKDVSDAIIEHPDVRFVAWGVPPYAPSNYFDLGVDDKWHNPQRYKMLAGFVHVPASYVTTRYWLKLDLDVVATGNDDWVDESWFDGDPAIVAHRWGYTKPPNQMQLLDAWHQKVSCIFDPLNLVPKEGSSTLSHKRIISWCGFFNTEFTELCAALASKYCGVRKLPVPSQDGYLWYMAAARGKKIVRCNMKARGWRHLSNLKNIKDAVLESLHGQQDSQA